MHNLTRNFAMKIEEKIKEDEIASVFGPPLKYKNIFLGKCKVGNL